MKTHILREIGRRKPFTGREGSCGCAGLAATALAKAGACGASPAYESRCESSSRWPLCCCENTWPAY